MVVDAEKWVQRLPHIIEAVMFAKGGDEQLAKRIHADILKAFKLYEEQLPLLKYDQKHLDAPFRLVVTADWGRA